jgi:hypothetical protein
MTVTQTHNEIVLRPPPGTRFTIWGSDVILQFEHGKELEVLIWLQKWIEAYVEPQAKAAHEKFLTSQQLNLIPNSEGNDHG